MFQKQRDFSILTAKENRCKDYLWHRPSCKRTQGICRCHIHHELYLLPPQQKDSNRLYHAIPTATLDEFFSGRAIKVRHSAKLRLPDATAFQLQWKLARSRLWHVHPGSNFDNSRGVFGTSLSSYILEKAASRKLDKGPSLESWKMGLQLHQTSNNKTSEFSGFSKVGDHFFTTEPPCTRDDGATESTSGGTVKVTIGSPLERRHQAVGAPWD